MDADEATVLGAARHAANLSDGIKFNDKLGMIDGSSYGFTIELIGTGLSDNYESTKQLLVPRMEKLPSKLFRSIEHDKDFEVSPFYESADMLPPGVSSDKFSQYAVSGLTDVSKKYSSHNLSAPIKATIHFSLSRSGILSLTKVDAVIEISEWVEVPEKNLTVDYWTNSGTEKKLKKRTFRVPLKVVEKAFGPRVSLSEESLSEAKLRLNALDKKDADRRRTAELKNDLEAYIYATREKLESSVEIEKVSIKQECQPFIEKLDEVEEWLYSDGEEASASEFKERLDLLKATGDALFFILNEVTAWPDI